MLENAASSVIRYRRYRCPLCQTLKQNFQPIDCTVTRHLLTFHCCWRTAPSWRDALASSLPTRRVGHRGSIRVICKKATWLTLKFWPTSGRLLTYASSSTLSPKTKIVITTATGVVQRMLLYLRLQSSVLITKDNSASAALPILQEQFLQRWGRLMNFAPGSLVSASSRFRPDHTTCSTSTYSHPQGNFTKNCMKSTPPKSTQPSH